MGVTVLGNIGLDASVTQGLIKSIHELNDKGNWAMARVSTLALPELACLDGLSHSGKALVGIPASVIVAGGRFLGISAANKSEYSVRKEALHVVRAIAHFASAFGHAILLLSLASFVKPTVSEKMNNALGLNTPWEKVTKVSGFKQRAIQQVVQACAGTKKVVKLVISNKDPKLTRKVIGAGVGLAALAGAGAWLLSGSSKGDVPNVPNNNPAFPIPIELPDLGEDTRVNGWIQASVVIGVIATIATAVGICWCRKKGPKVNIQGAKAHAAFPKK